MPKCVKMPNCQQKKNRCGKPNAWVEHLIAYGGKGLTRRQLSEKYRRGSKSVIQACRRVRNRGRDWHLDAEVVMTQTVAQYLEDPTNRLQVANINMNGLRKKVVREMSKRSNPLRLTDNFAGSSLTPERLAKLAEIIDSVYWNGTLMNALNKRIRDPRGVVFTVINDPSSNPTGITHIRMTNLFGEKPATTNLEFNRASFENIDLRCSSGLKARTKLESLSITMQHELMHALTMSTDYFEVYRQGYGGHGTIWRRAWHNFHGGSLTKYTYDDNPEQVHI